MSLLAEAIFRAVLGPTPGTVCSSLGAALKTADEDRIFQAVLLACVDQLLAP